MVNMKKVYNMDTVDGMNLFLKLKKDGRNVRLAIWEKCTHIYLDDRYLDTFNNEGHEGGYQLVSK